MYPCTHLFVCCKDGRILSSLEWTLASNSSWKIKSSRILISELGSPVLSRMSLTKSTLSMAKTWLKQWGSRFISSWLVTDKRSRSRHVAQTFMLSIRRTQSIHRGMLPQVLRRSPVATHLYFRPGLLTSKKGKGKVFILHRLNQPDT